MTISVPVSHDHSVECLALSKINFWVEHWKSALQFVLASQSAFGSHMTFTGSRMTTACCTNAYATISNAIWWHPISHAQVHVMADMLAREHISLQHAEQRWKLKLTCQAAVQSEKKKWQNCKADVTQITNCGCAVQRDAGALGYCLYFCAYSECIYRVKTAQAYTGFAGKPWASSNSERCCSSNSKRCCCSPSWSVFNANREEQHCFADSHVLHSTDVYIMC